MKHISILGILLIIFSCSSSETEAAESLILPDSSLSLDDEAYVPEDPITRVYELSELPSKWWLLTDEDGGFVRYDHWDAQDEYIEFFSDEDGAWSLEILYPQDTDSGPVTNFQATISEGDGISIVEGSFAYTSYYTETPETVTFNWDQLRYYIEFNNLIPGETTYYVADESKDFFPFEETFREED